MNDPQTFELIPVEALLERVEAFRQQGYRLVQICAATLQDRLELTYSFDLADKLVNLRLHRPLGSARVPSISSIYWAAFIYENEMHDLFGLRVDGMAIDFGGQFYKTAVKYAFGSPKPPVNPAAPAKPTPGATAVVPSAN